MSNRAYLTVTPWQRIYPSFGDLAFEPAQHTALSSAGCVPLTWLALFSAGDLASHAFPGHPDPFSAPLAPTAAATARLRERRDWLAELYADRGPLAGHIDLLLAHLAPMDGAWISIELEEIAALQPEPAAWQRTLGEVLAALDRRDPEVRGPLAELATVMLDERFVALEEASTATRREQWNFFRLLGEGWARPAAWD
ncbi:MAG: hypothetical protein HS111_28420 [Kofleriaceae bacterium]|nr:hypothetical protein [Kofleriaceae bacterium]MCL4223566.1 hypothetical protein [Myxococcales bacterium]